MHSRLVNHLIRIHVQHVWPARANINSLSVKQSFSPSKTVDGEISVIPKQHPRSPHDRRQSSKEVRRFMYEDPNLPYTGVIAPKAP